MTRPDPPRLARRLAAACLRGEAREVICGDLDEEFAEAIARGTPVRAARRHYWRQTVASIIAIRRDGQKETSMLTRSWFRPFRGLSLDLRSVGRVLRRSPGYAVVAVLSLAIGIGANTAIFSLVRQLLLETLPVERPSELKLAYWTDTAGARLRTNQRNSSGYRDPANGVTYRSNYSYPQYTALRHAPGVAADVCGFNFIRQLTASVEGHPPTLVAGILVSGNFFTTVRPPLAFGRGLEEDDDRPGAPAVAVISHGFWMTTFGGDAVLGRIVRLNDVPVIVVGVTAASFRGLSQGGFFPQTDVTVALAEQPAVVPEWASPGQSLFTSDLYWLRVLVRVRPEAVPPATQALQAALRSEMLHAGLAPDVVSTVTSRMLPGGRGLDSLRPDTEQPLFILSGVVAVVLLIACVNVAGLMLARGVARQRELAVRRALGAGRLRLMRPLLLESLVLSVAGGVAGLLLALWGGPIIASMLTAGLGATGVGVSLDWSLLALTAGLSCVTGVLCGLLPALRFSRNDRGTFLKDRGAIAGSPKLTAGRILLALQIAVSLPLVVGAGLFLRTLHNLSGVTLGFNPDGLVLFTLDPTMNGRFPDRAATVFPRLLERLERIPGLASATLMENALISGWMSNTTVTIDGQEREMYMNAVGPRYFETMGVPIRAGRAIGSEDRAGTPHVVVLNETAVRQYFGGVSPVGRHFSMGTASATSSLPALIHAFPSGDAEIVGVAADSKYDGLRNDIKPTMFQPYLQRSLGEMHVVVRTAASVNAQRAVQQAVEDVDPTLPIKDFKTQTDQIEEATAKEQVFTRLLTLFGGFALLLACIGLHGVTSYSVARRTSEIGIRLALGAQRSQVLWLVLRQVVVLAMVGLSLGLPAAWLAGPIVRSFLFGLGPNDPATLIISALVMFGVAVAAGLMPARRAARMEALAALRSE